MLELTRAWAAVTGLGLIALLVGIVALGRTPTNVLPMLIAGIFGYEMALTGYDYWRRRHHG